jgi:archaemetzincin
VVRLSILRIGLLAPNAVEEIMKCLEKYKFVAAEKAGIMINPESAFDGARRQYRADVLIEMMKKTAASPAKKIGLCDVDLFLPLFTHLFGYAPLGSDSAVVSMARLRARDEETEKELAGLSALRGAKEVLHEAGHLMGLKHCPVAWCVMKPSLEPEEIDLKDLSYCEICAELIKEAAK